jgi:hypothetical protein
MDATGDATMLGTIESAIVAVAIAVPVFLVVKRSTMTYAAGLVPRWWQVWR